MTLNTSCFWGSVSVSQHFNFGCNWLDEKVYMKALLELLIGDMFLTPALVLPQAAKKICQPWSKLHRLPACWQHYKSSHKEGEHLENCRAIVTWINATHILRPNYSSHNRISLWVYFMNSSFQSKLYENEILSFSFYVKLFGLSWSISSFVVFLMMLPCGKQF